MHQSDETTATRWLPILYLTAIGLLLFVVPTVMPLATLTIAKGSDSDNADPFGEIWRIVLIAAAESFWILEAVLIREIIFRLNGWRSFILVTLAVFVLGSVVFAPPILEIERSLPATGVEQLLEAVSGSSPPQTYWWLLPSQFSFRLIAYAFLIGVTEMFFPQQRTRWLSSWKVGVCGAVVVLIRWGECLEEAKFIQANVRVLAFSWLQASVGIAIAVGLLVAARRHAKRISPISRESITALAPLVCGAVAFAFGCGLLLISFTESFIAGFSGNHTFKSNIARCIRLSSDSALLIAAAWMLSRNIRKKGFDTKHRIAVLLGGYAATRIENFGAYTSFPSICVVTAGVVNLVAFLFAGYLFRWIWVHLSVPQSGEAGE